MNFDEIVLSKDEMKLLNILAKKGPVLVETDNWEITQRLAHFGLAEILPITNPNIAESIRRESGGILPGGIQITSMGRDYLVYQAAQVAGGKHSALMAPVRDTVNYPEFAPEARMLEGGIAYVKLPEHSGAQVSDSLYAYSVLHFLQEHSSAVGVVIDLRDNTGGNMYPMISAVSPLLPDGVILQFKGKKRTSPIMLDFVLRIVGINASEPRISGNSPKGRP